MQMVILDKMTLKMMKSAGLGMIMSSPNPPNTGKRQRTFGHFLSVKYLWNAWISFDEEVENMKSPQTNDYRQPVMIIPKWSISLQ